MSDGWGNEEGCGAGNGVRSQFREGLVYPVKGFYVIATGELLLLLITNSLFSWQIFKQQKSSTVDINNVKQ